MLSAYQGEFTQRDQEAAKLSLLAELAEPLETTEEQVAYVYLFLVDTLHPIELEPNAKIPFVEFPTAAPAHEGILAAVAELFASVEYVYLFLVVTYVDP